MKGIPDLFKAVVLERGNEVIICGAGWYLKFPLVKWEVEIAIKGFGAVFHLSFFLPRAWSNIVLTQSERIDESE